MKMNGMIGSLVKMAMRAGMDVLNRKSRQTPTRTAAKGGAKGGKPAAAEKKLQNSARDTAKRARQAAKITRRLGK